MRWRWRSITGSKRDRVRLWVKARRNGSVLRWPFRLPRLPGTDPVAQVSIGERTFVGQRTWIEVAGPQAQIRLGSGILMGEDVHLAAAELVEIGDGSLIGARSTIMDYNHDWNAYLRRALLKGERPIADFGTTPPAPIRIGTGVYMGVACVVVPGVTIGDGCVIGANSIVTRDLPDYTFAAGVPARPIRDLRADLLDPGAEPAEQGRE